MFTYCVTLHKNYLRLARILSKGILHRALHHSNLLFENDYIYISIIYKKAHFNNNKKTKKQVHQRIYYAYDKLRHFDECKWAINQDIEGKYLYAAKYRINTLELNEISPHKINTLHLIFVFINFYILQFPIPYVGQKMTNQSRNLLLK